MTKYLTQIIQPQVQSNPYENYRVALSGEGYQEDVTFDGLPGDSLEELRIPDGPLGRPRVETFALRNHSATKAFRCAGGGGWG